MSNRQFENVGIAINRCAGHSDYIRWLAVFLFFSIARAAIAEGGQIVVSAHLMAQESPYMQRNNKFDADSPNGVMATHLEQNLFGDATPLSAAQADLDRAKNAGLTTLNMLLGPNHLPKSYVSEMMNAYWKAAIPSGSVKMAVDIWTGGTPDETAKLNGALGYLMDNYDGAWQRYQGRRLVLLMLTSDLKTVESTQLDKMFIALGGRKSIYLVIYQPNKLREKNPALLAIADAVTTWPHSDYARELALVTKDAAAASSAGKEYWYPAMPAFMQSRPDGNIKPTIREKLGATNFSVDWLRAIENRAKGINIATWNDLTEDSALMPESNHADAFAMLSKYFAKWLMIGHAPSVDQEIVLLFHHPQLVRSTKLPIGRNGIESLSWNITPATDYISIVSMLKKPATFRISVGGQPITPAREVSAGYSQMLLFCPAKGARPDAYQIADRRIAFIPVAQFEAGKVQVIIEDQSGYRFALISRHDILGAANRAELTTIGSTFFLAR